MTHTPDESKAWPRAGADDKPAASGEQTKPPRGSDLPAAGSESDRASSETPPVPEAGRHDGDRR